MNDSNDGLTGFRIRIPPEIEAIPYARLILRWALPDIDDTTTALYYGAVTEVATNAIAAHGEAEVSEPIEFQVHSAVGSQSIEVRDQGTGFDPLDVDRSTDGESGFGLNIARAVCPNLVIKSSSSGTSVLLPFPQSPSL